MIGDRNHREILSEYMGGKFYENVCRAVDVLHQVREMSDGHGVTLAIRNGPSEDLEMLLEESEPFNGRAHRLYDADIVDAISARRDNDGANIVDEQGVITHSQVVIPFDHVKYKKDIGLTRLLKTFLGYEAHEEAPGTRNKSSLAASYDYGDVIAFVTLGENMVGQPKGPVNVYFCGDRPYNSEGREMQWDLATNPPEHVSSAYGCDKPQKIYEGRPRIRAVI